MFETPFELAQAIGARIRSRRLILGWTQAEVAERSGISYRTWRRLEAEGKASIDDLVRAAIALRCEEGLKTLFPEPSASSMDALLERQQATERDMIKRRARAPRRV
ncbi:helix-turn-helix domain-containing protein [Sphingobium boeckii]|uniref:helix-turn-helix domain-containing protein n=1 Tax=Sphingobium boeckii TaxID=1082345 RepID=UPI00161AF102